MFRWSKTVSHTSITILMTVKLAEDSRIKKTSWKDSTFILKTSQSTARLVAWFSGWLMV